MNVVVSICMDTELPQMIRALQLQAEDCFSKARDHLFYGDLPDALSKLREGQTLLRVATRAFPVTKTKSWEEALGAFVDLPIVKENRRLFDELD